jgi:hypothetical protein
MHKLTTQHLAAIAAQRLTHMREAAAREHLAAQLMPGTTQAYACSKRIDGHMQRAYGIALLADVCASVGDHYTAERIGEQIDAPVSALIGQSLDARLASVPKEAA